MLIRSGRHPQCQRIGHTVGVVCGWGRSESGRKERPLRSEGREGGEWLTCFNQTKFPSSQSSSNFLQHSLNLFKLSIPFLRNQMLRCARLFLRIFFQSMSVPAAYEKLIASKNMYKIFSLRGSVFQQDNQGKVSVCPSNCRPSWNAF